MKLAIIDIDRVIVDCTKRFEQAMIDGKIIWEKALSSELLHLDELMPLAIEHLTVIREHYDQIILLTSRYDHMRDTSLVWLAGHGINYDRAIFKPWNDRYTKTKKWKADEVAKILREASQPGLWSSPQGSVTEVLILEDNEDNQQEISQTVAQWILSNKQARACYYLSLQEAVQAIQSQQIDKDTDLGELASVEDHPF